MAAEYVSCGDVANADNINQFSIAFWVNFGTVSTDQYIISKGAHNVSGDPWAIKLDAAGALEFSVSNSITAIDTDLYFKVRTWYHIVITYSNTADAIIFYLNSTAHTVSEDSFTINTSGGGYDTIPTNTGREVRIGTGYDSGNVSPLYFKGKLQEIGLWNTALASTEVAAIYNNGRSLNLAASYGGYTQQGSLQAYWKMNDGKGSSFADSSGNKNTGTGTNIEASNWVKGKSNSVIKADKDAVKMFKELDLTNAQFKLSFDTASYATMNLEDASHLAIATQESGNITLDAGGNIELNADGGTIDFKDASVNLATLTAGSLAFNNSKPATLVIDSTAAGTAGKKLIIEASTAATAGSNNTNGGDLELKAGGGDGTGTSAMTFFTKVSGTDAAAERMRIHTDGNVGIGVADPDTTLEVNGNGKVTHAGTTTHALEIDATALTTGSALLIDVNDSLTASATKSLLYIDYDKSGVTASGQASLTTGLSIDMADAATNNASGAVYLAGISINIDSANAQGNIFQKGILLTVAADGVGDAVSTYGIDMEVMNGGTDLIMRSSANTADYCSIATTASGATTIATQDSADAEAAHLTFDIQGDTIFKGDIADGTSTEVARIDSSASSLLMASGKKIEFNNANSFIYGVSDIFLTGSRHLFLTANSGDVVIDAGGANITLQDDAGTYTPTAASDATTKAYVDANVYHFIRGGFNNSGTSKNFIPMAGAEDLREGTTMSTFGEKYSFICPYDGSFEKAYARSEINCGSSIFGFHHSAGAGDEVPSDTATSTVTVTMGTDDTSYEFDFTGVTNTFSKGDIIAFSFDPFTAPNDVHFMIVLKFDVST